MHRYILKRIAFLIPTILGVTFIIYAVLNITPSSPGQAILGPSASPAAIEEFNHQVGYDQPFLTKYFNYVKNMVTKADFGISYFTKQSVFNEVWPRFMVTIKLSLSGVALAALIGVPLGILAAVKQYSLIDSCSTIFALIFISIPTFWLGLMMIILFSVQLHWLPPNGSETLAHFIMPAITCAGTTLATLIRMTRSTMLEVIRQDYIRTAYAKGAAKGRVIVKHALQNAFIPIITIVGVNFGYMLGGAVITENVFGMSGIGNLLLSSIRSKDIPMVMGGVLIVAVMFSIVNLLLDICYAYVDPRVKAQYKKGGA